ncbi:MAG TPA: hypothetical protein DC042_17875 [Bacteroidales bacterium]|nr:hypothetical protein [Bacteroidales bacterium]
MEQHLIKVVLNNRIWYYCHQTHRLFHDPDLLSESCTLENLTTEENAELQVQVEKYVQGYYNLT